MDIHIEPSGLVVNVSKDNFAICVELNGIKL